MCGISGFVGEGAGGEPEKLLRKLNAGITHRGPDDEGYYQAPQVGLAMRRLSIVDLDGSRQPIANEEGTVYVVFNGEIYNYVELREWLEGRGHILATQGDTEVLVHLYEELGIEMLHKLRGMFAFALWDTRDESLFLARDRLGKKPLFYAPMGGGLRFCSEIAPLAASAGISRTINPAALAQYLTLGYVPAPLTMYEGIQKLPPGHFLTWRKGELKVRRYWRMSFEPGPIQSRAEALELVREKLDESIRLRLRSDVPVGLLLSGGLDSNAVLARLVRGLGRRVTAFTVGFENPNYDESSLARRSAEHFGVEHHVLSGKAEMLDLLPTLIRHYGEPYADKSALPSLFLCGLTRQKVKVALNGDGGDEAFAGYRKYRVAARRRVMAGWLPNRLRTKWAKASLRGDGLAGTKLSRNLRRMLLPETESLFSSEFFAGGQFRALATPDFYAQAASALNRSLDGYWEASPDPVNRMLAWDYGHYLADDLLVKMDIASMARGLEVRSPLLDHELVELCAGLPSDWKVDARSGKKLLHEIVAADLPADLLSAPKRGFSVPLADWWRGTARNQLQDGLADLHPSLCEFINSRVVDQLLEEHQQGRRNHAQRLWALWVLNAWAWDMGG